jgi:hypothetical protein
MFRRERFIFDSRRFVFSTSFPHSDLEVIRISDRHGVLSFAAGISRDAEGGKAFAEFQPESPALIRELRRFERKRGFPIPARFARAWDDSLDSPEQVETSLVEMIRKTIDNMHMVHTVAPDLLPPFPMEYICVPEEPGPASDPACSGGPVVEWSRVFESYLPPGPPKLSREDRIRLFRYFMTDDSMAATPEHRGPAMRLLRDTFSRVELPYEEWVVDPEGRPFRPPSLPLYLVRLTNIRWMNETAEVYRKRRRAGLESAFSSFVRMLKALPDSKAQTFGESPSHDAAYGAALLVNWLLPHMNLYPPAGLGHEGDRIDFVTTRLLFTEILNPYFERNVAFLTADSRSVRVRHILRALRDGFIQEASLPGSLWPRFLPLFREQLSRSGFERLSPLSRRPGDVSLLLEPLADPGNQPLEAARYGLGRSICDGREFFSETLLGRNLSILEGQCRRAAPEASRLVPWKNLVSKAANAMARITGAAVQWSDLSERDRSYVTAEEIEASGFKVLPRDWRARVAAVRG